MRKFYDGQPTQHISMNQDTNKGQKTDQPGMNGKWFYTLIDGSYRVHTRLYKLHYAVVHTEKTIYDLFKINMISNGIEIGVILGLVALYVQIVDIKLSPEFYLTLIIIVFLLFSVLLYQFKQAGKIKKELFEISGEIKVESLETWPGYLWDEAAKWGTRISMVKQILKENENIHPDKQEESYILTKKSFTRILEYSINELENIKKVCETCLSEKPEFKNYDETIEICNEFIELGER